MPKHLYLEPIGGISGDMMLGLLIDLGASLEKIQSTLDNIDQVPPLDICKTHEQRHHIGGVKISITPKEQPKQSKNYREISQLLTINLKNQNVLKQALSIFEKLAQAEAKVHQCPVESVHFHEVGAWDSIADIVGVAVALDDLDIHKITVSEISIGKGFIETAHGTMPIPAPATLELLCGFEVVHDTVKFERVTPTGAAILSALATPMQVNHKTTIQKIGIGIGTKNLDAVPNILRGSLALCDCLQQTADSIEQLECAETNIDDSLPEWLGYTQERLFEAGACDVIFLHTQMKKNRPAILVQVLYTPEKRNLIHHILLSETSSLGVRFYPLQRRALKRTFYEVQTQWGKINGKCTTIDGMTYFQPEFEECRKIAKHYHLSIRHVYQTVHALFHQ